MKSFLRKSVVTGLLAALCMLSGARLEARSSDDELLNFSSRWLAAKTVSKPGPGGTYTAKAFERFVLTGNVAYPIGNVIYLKFPKAREAGHAPARFDPEEISAQLLGGLGLDAWKVKRREGRAYVFESDWPVAHRWVRVYAAESEDSIEVSVVNFRIAYAEDVAVESELIQRQLFGVLGAKVPWLRKMVAETDAFGDARYWAADLLEGGISRFLGTDAWAQGGAASCPACPAGLPANVCSAYQAQCNVAGASNNLASASSNLQNISNFVGQLDPGSINKAAGTVGGIDPGAVNGVLKNLQQISPTDINNALASVPSLANSASSMANSLQEFVDPGHAFVWAAMSAAGAALGASAISMAVDGIAAAGKALVKAIAGKSGAELFEAFKVARKEYTEISSAQGSLEAALDNMLALDELQKQFHLSRGQIVASLGPLASQLRARSDSAYAKLRAAIDGNSSAACVDFLSQRHSQLEDQAKLLAALHEKLSNLPDAKVCDQLAELIGKIQQAEGDLNLARGDITAGQSAWGDVWRDKQDDLTKNVEHEKADARRECDHQVDWLKDRLKQRVATQQLIAYNWIRDCEGERRGMFSWVAVPDGDGLTGGGDRGPSNAWLSCERDYYRTPQGQRVQAEIDKENRLYDQGVTDAQTARDTKIQASQRRVISQMDETANGSYKQYSDWFVKVAKESANVDLTAIGHLRQRGAKLDSLCPGIVARTRLNEQ